MQGNFAYVADRSRLTIVDVEFPSSPWVVSDLASSFTNPLGVYVRDTLAYLHSFDMQTVVSVADSSASYWIGWTFIPLFSGTEPKGISVVDTIAYLADGNQGLQIINVAITNSPTVIGSYNTPGITIDLFVKDSLAYIADLDSLQIINIVDPTAPFRVGAIAMPTNCYDIFVVANYAFVACQSTSGNNGSLQVVDVTVPSSPSIVASVNNISGDPLDLYIQGTYVYVAAADHFLPNVEGGLRIIDISNPLSPMLVASYDTPGDPRGVFAVFPYVYVADYDSLQILEHVIVGVEEDSQNAEHLIPHIRLFQNYPNPFNRSTVIRYQLSTFSSVSLKIYDVTGRLIKTLTDEQQGTGLHMIYWDGEDWNGNDVASGVYFYRLFSSRETKVKKLILIR